MSQRPRATVACLVRNNGVAGGRIRVAPLFGPFEVRSSPTLFRIQRVSDSEALSDSSHEMKNCLEAKVHHQHKSLSSRTAININVVTAVAEPFSLA